MAALAASVWASAALAAPVSCTESAAGDDGFLSYRVDRFDLVAMFDGFVETRRPADCAASFTGTVDTRTGMGRALFNGRDEYRVGLTGDLGTSFFFDETFFEDFDLISELPPPYRFDFRPVSGRGTEPLFPGGISLSFECGVTDSCEDVPSFLILEREIDGRPTPYLISNDGLFGSVSALEPIAAIPLPATLPLAAAALLGLGAFGWSGARTRAALSSGGGTRCSGSGRRQRRRPRRGVCGRPG